MLVEFTEAAWESQCVIRVIVCVCVFPCPWVCVLLPFLISVNWSYKNETFFQYYHQKPLEDLQYSQCISKINVIMTYISAAIWIKSSGNIFSGDSEVISWSFRILVHMTCWLDSSIQQGKQRSCDWREREVEPSLLDFCPTPTHCPQQLSQPLSHQWAIPMPPEHHPTESLQSLGMTLRSSQWLWECQWDCPWHSGDSRGGESRLSAVEPSSRQACDVTAALQGKGFLRVI